MHNRVRRLRLQMKWKQRELAQTANVCQSLLSDIERGVRVPWPNIKEQISGALGVPVEVAFPERKTRSARSGGADAAR